MAPHRAPPLLQARPSSHAVLLDVVVGAREAPLSKLLLGPRTLRRLASPLRRQSLKPVLKTGGPVRALLLRGRRCCVLQASAVLELRPVLLLLLLPKHLPSGLPLLQQPLLHPT